MDAGLTGQRILLVEDDLMLGEALYELLMQHGMAVDWHKDGERVVHVLGQQRHDLMILDLGLPIRSGVQVLQQVRQLGFDIPVLILTARDGRAERVRALDTGADDYVLKPFDMDELLARLRAILRRSQGRSRPMLTHTRVTLDPIAMSVTLDSQKVVLSRQEFRLLHVLLERVGQVLTRDRLEAVLLDAGSEIESNSLEVHVHHLRKKLYPELIKTLRGVGYMVPQA